MEIIYLKNSDSSGYLSLIERKYKNQKNYDYFLSGLQTSLSFSQNYQDPRFVVLKKDGEIIGHCALILDSKLKEGEAFFGFFDVIDDITVFDALWQNFLKLAKDNNVKTLKGPINGTVWHPYRVVSSSDNSNFFKTELFCELYYYDFFKTLQPSKEIFYHSGFRENFEHIISVTGKAYRNAMEKGFIIEEAKNINLSQLQDVFESAKIVFKDNWSYTDLSVKNFESLYSSKKLNATQNKIYFIKKSDKIVGYLGSLIEDEETLILKTIAVLPEFRGKGFGNALIHKVHCDASDSGYKKVIYALIREDNDVKNFSNDDATVFRKYSAFEFEI
jgi:N-acetylglutamate synthase-like GNAT family acetyltransferase